MAPTPCPVEGCLNEAGAQCLARDCAGKPPSEVDQLKAQVATLDARLEAAEVMGDDLDRRVGATEARAAEMDVRLDQVEAVSLPVASSEIVR